MYRTNNQKLSGESGIVNDLNLVGSSVMVVGYLSFVFCTENPFRITLFIKLADHIPHDPAKPFLFFGNIFSAASFGFQPKCSHHMEKRMGEFVRHDS